MQDIIFVVHVLSVVSLIGLVLIQHGKGADAGAAFGSGSSNTMFGSGGSISFFAKVTALIAVTFFATSITLGIMVAKQSKRIKETSIISTIPVKPAEPVKPVDLTKQVKVKPADPVKHKQKKIEKKK